MKNGSHSFHIPVMGTGFTIDTPLRVAKYGISSVIPLVDDVLVEQVRKYHCEKHGEPYEEISNRDQDARALRITAYLNLLDRLIRPQIEGLQASPFEDGSEITRYFEMLPETPLKQAYGEMLATTEPEAKARMQEDLRQRAVPGSIDVNIMTKLDRDVYWDGKKLPAEFTDAMAALRGFANSTLNSSVVFSAGINQRLYAYAATFDDFFPDDNGELKKKIILKVSDYRSASIQGRFLAKKGLWVSEYRIESGLNCGGHAFATDGYLLGPVLEEFKEKRQELTDTLHAAYAKALADRGWSVNNEPHEMGITVQGGIATALENEFLLRYYMIDRTGWGTPFLLVPEVTNVDNAHLEKLLAATDGDVYLSDSSPLGIPFWNLRTSASEETRRQHIREGKPGSPCLKGAARLNTEFTEIPICPSSRVYVKRKLQHLPEEGLSAEQLAAAKESVLRKSCICHDLGGSTALKYDIDPAATPSICCGPSILDFSKISTLEEMVAHIYGRLSLMTNKERPHMFIKELMLYIDHLREETKNFSLKLSFRTPAYFSKFKKNLLAGIEYYHRLAGQFIEEQRKQFLADLKVLQDEIERLAFPDVG
ncbi:MAG: hypothetical protein OEU80_05165 [Deltaproteobacteria bacterium]|nr:hypothetical protein [Deltaproteobacteria bacterium]MDH3801459.1 hypothetical protein [Deltaproteobacteria bacterium]MDH3850937.1 hypothetical protein [Deltaproteobacteria bacterium]MDH3928584.1 hypothetical protein [Deltaproteobacteria bacterium]MDH3951302.1 hypothetical protein [Deltaproteobacteria bacterium]